MRGLNASHLVEAAWRNHASAVRRFVHKRIGCEADAEDLVQETFMRLFRSEAQWPDNLSAWLYRTAGRLVVDYYRSRRTFEGLPDGLRAPEPDAVEQVRDELIDCLPGLVARLPEPYREALTLSDLERVPQRVIAERQAISLSGAKSRVQRARLLLRNVLDACCWFEKGRGGTVTDFKPKRPADCVFSSTHSS